MINVPFGRSQLSALAPDVEWPRFHSVLLAIDYAVVDSPTLISDLDLTDEVVDATCRALDVDKVRKV